MSRRADRTNSSRNTGGVPRGQRSRRARPIDPHRQPPLAGGVVVVVALLMVVSLVDFVLKPDPAVKAVPTYVTLTLTTGAALLMFLMALNATFLPFISRERRANFQLVMWAMGVTGIVTGLLTLGGAASPYITRLIFAGMAFTFIMIQDARLARAARPRLAPRLARPRRSARSGAGAASRARQRRGGHKH